MHTLFPGTSDGSEAEKLVSALKEAIALLDEDDRVMHVNGAASRVFIYLMSEDNPQEAKKRDYELMNALIKSGLTENDIAILESIWPKGFQLTDLIGRLKKIADTLKKTVQPANLSTRTDINLMIYPSLDRKDPSDNTVTLGDIHGNMLKLLYLLIKEGVISIPEDSYNTIRDIYFRSQHLTSSDLNKINACLKMITIPANAPSVRLIGDILADRGNNDLLTLQLLNRLHNLSVDYEILASNHDNEFIKQYAHGLSKDIIMLYQDYDDSQYKIFGRSFYGLNNAIKDNVIDENDVIALFKTAYMPHAKLLSYHFSDNDATLTLFTHAPIEQDTLDGITTLCNTTLNDTRPETLRKVIDCMNQEYRNKLTHLNGIKEFLDAPPYLNLTGDRYENLKTRLLASGSADKYIAYRVINVHGHVGTEKLAFKPKNNWAYINLDNNLGKDDENLQNPYPVYHTIELRAQTATLVTSASAAAAAASTTSSPTEPQATRRH